MADEARSYKNSALRPSILARSADALWEADEVTARSLFRRAWDAAEKADAEDEPPSPSKGAPPAMVIALRKLSGGDLRSEVLNLAARRDRTLAEEFLAKLIEAQTKAAEQSANGAPENPNDSWTTSHEASKRLRLADRLLDDNQTERAFEFAAPVLIQVNDKTISFLSRLRLQKPDLADKQFLLLLGRAEVEPTSDANTVSGLSSYAFTPGLYLTFAADGGVRWIPALNTINAPDLSPIVRNAFFRVAGTILLRPSPPPDEDVTSAGRTGKYMVIKRLLPLFEQYAPDIAVALKSQLVALTMEASSSLFNDDDSFITQGLKRDANPKTILDRLQERIDRAKDERERDTIYADVAAILATQGDARAQSIADKIESEYRRKVTSTYVDLYLIRVAIEKKDVAAVLRFAKSEDLTHVHRAWTYVQVARLLMRSDRTRALETLEEALAEARRVELDEPRRTNLMIGVASEFLNADSVRPWEVAEEAVKAANADEEFVGEDIGLSVPLMTSSGLKILELDTTGFNLSSLVRLLAKQDFTRVTDLAKSLKSEAPRALATLSVASVALEKPRKQE